MRKQSGGAELVSPLARFGDLKRYFRGGFGLVQFTLGAAGKNGGNDPRFNLPLSAHHLPSPPLNIAGGNLVEGLATGGSAIANGRALQLTGGGLVEGAKRAKFH